MNTVHEISIISWAQWKKSTFSGQHVSKRHVLTFLVLPKIHSTFRPNLSEGEPKHVIFLLFFTRFAKASDTSGR